MYGKFIVKYKGVYDGVSRDYYHSDISNVDPKKGVMNVYCEHVSTDKKDAKVFYSSQEAQGIIALFGHSYNSGKVIKKR